MGLDKFKSNILPGQERNLLKKNIKFAQIVGKNKKKKHKILFCLG
jgi:hypothetical protein